MKKNKKRVAIFDLDNTLIDTRKLEKLRKERKWKEVYNNFHQTYLNPKVKNYVIKLSENIFTDFFIVTSSPRSYAKQLLAYHNFFMDKKIIAYHDTNKHKPHEEPYLKALSFVKDYYDEVFIFGDLESDFISAENLKKVIHQKVYKISCSWYVDCNYKGLDRYLTEKDL